MGRYKMESIKEKLNRLNAFNTYLHSFPYGGSEYRNALNVLNALSLRNSPYRITMTSQSPPIKCPKFKTRANCTAFLRERFKLSFFHKCVLDSCKPSKPLFSPHNVGRSCGGLAEILSL